MGIKLLNPHVLVRPDAPITQVGSVQLPDFLAKKAAEGQVVEVGRFVFTNGVEFDLGVRVGDKILYRPHDGERVQVDGEDFLLLTMQQIIGVLTKENIDG